MRSRFLLLAALAAAAPPLAAQGWRLSLDARSQAVTYRGWQVDSIPVADTVAGSGGGPTTPDGFVVRCDPVTNYCRFWRPGSTIRAVPTVLTADGTLWGLGIAGLSLRANARLGTDLAGGRPWYGPDRSVELVEGYADYDHGTVQARLGRQLVSGRLGWWGVDGVRGWVRTPARTLELSGYTGWGLARSSNLTATSAALNVLGDFQTGKRQWAAGGVARWAPARGSLQAEYHREWSGTDHGIVIERAAAGGELLATKDVALTGGAIYDLASGLWGSWDLGTRVTLGSRLSANARIRQYRPLFDLWSVWQVFSPVPYHAMDGGIGFRVDPRLSLRASGERYWFPDTHTETPLVTIEHAGWRTSVGATWSPRPGLDVDLDLHREFGVGAYANSEQGSVTWLPAAGWTVSFDGGHLRRPLDYRYDVARLWWIGVGIDRHLSDRLRIGFTADRYDEARQRPDAAGASWDQARLALRATWLFVSGADRLPLPPGRPRGAP